MGRQRPRLHWCATRAFAFLPLHASGYHDQSAQKSRESCADYVVSSYTPTISALLKAQKGFSSIAISAHRAFLVSEPAARGMAPLPGVRTELQVIKEVLDKNAPLLFTNNEMTSSSVSEVITGLATASIVHFACHGVQNTESPLKSGFCLRDGSLTVAQIMRLRHDDAVLAFLSACETAQGDQAEPDQSLHLCAAMLFCGFKSVIGTMWWVLSTY
jgi:CHAT domain-containing protein